MHGNSPRSRTALFVSFLHFPLVQAYIDPVHSHVRLARFHPTPVFLDRERLYIVPCGRPVCLDTAALDRRFWAFPLSPSAIPIGVTEVSTPALASAAPSSPTLPPSQKPAASHRLPLPSPADLCPTGGSTLLANSHYSTGRNWPFCVIVGGVMCDIY